MLHDTEACHLQVGLELGQRASVALEEAVEQESPGRVGERLEHKVIVGHHPKICDQTVTCQADVAVPVHRRAICSRPAPPGRIEGWTCRRPSTPATSRLSVGCLTAPTTW